MEKNKIKKIILVMMISLGLGVGANSVVQSQVKTPVKAPVKTQQMTTKPSQPCPYLETKSLDVVANPTMYLGKRVKIRATFDKFSTLGLDYKPAFRSSEKYISFLIKRDDVKNHTIPLSEMKIFMKRDEAEKYIELSPGDIVEFCGTVFSDALGDAWVDVEKFTVISSKPKDSTKK